jgi:hypothetical protein
MKNKTTIAGISITINFCRKINKEKIDLVYISQEPLATIYKGQQEGTYTVNIITHIPTLLKYLSGMNLGSGIFLNKEKDLFLNYNGVTNISTSIHNNDSGIILCRDFNIEYDCKDQVIENYDMYHVQFNYKLLSEKIQSVEAIIVKLINEDPETSRGTVTTVRDDQN